MGGHIVRRNRMIVFISEIRIGLLFKQRFGEGPVWLREGNHDSAARILNTPSRTTKHLDRLFTVKKSGFDSSSFKRVGDIACVSIHNKLESPQLPWPPWPHRFFSSLIKPSQPLLTIQRGVFQQQKRRGSHMVRD